MFSFTVLLEGARLIKEIDPDSTDAYVQAVAEPDRKFVNLSFSMEDAVITMNGKELTNGETYKVELTREDYGYTDAEITITGKDCLKQFTLEILKPAPRKVLYGLENRPQFHYTPPYGYMNDPNGMLYNAATGEYHFFYQANPYFAASGEKHWGHAVTKDLLTFSERPTALYPDEDGYCMWSGTGIIDNQNVAGLYDETTPPEARMILVYYMWKSGDTKAGLAFTKDSGESWIKAGRTLNFIGERPGHIDPKVLWSENLKKWVMVCACGNLYTSENLWDWIYQSKDIWWECPDLYEIEAEETKEKKYLRTYGGTFYRVGDLVEDGTVRFVSETENLPFSGDSLDRGKDETILQKYGFFSGKTGSLYATQHYANAPNNRIISVSWLVEQGLDASGIWAGAITVATEQKLHNKNGNYLLYSYPVKELETLRGKVLYSCKNNVVTPESDDILDGVSAIYADIDGTFALDESVTEFGFLLRSGTDGGSITVKYDTAKEMLIADYSKSGHDRYNGQRSMKMKLPENRRISLRILLDSIIIESFGNSGEASISSVFSRPTDCKGISFYVIGGNVRIKGLQIFEMKSIWERTCE